MSINIKYLITASNHSVVDDTGESTVDGLSLVVSARRGVGMCIVRLWHTSASFLTVASLGSFLTFGVSIFRAYCMATELAVSGNLRDAAAE